MTAWELAEQLAKLPNFDVEIQAGNLPLIGFDKQLVTKVQVEKGKILLIGEE